jgi:hypothetical protein
MTSMKFMEEIETFTRMCEAAARGNGRKRRLRGFAKGQRWAATWLRMILKNARAHDSQGGRKS